MKQRVSPPTAWEEMRRQGAKLALAGPTSLQSGFVLAANVDYETDTLIQTTLRDAPAFKGKSIIVIAHRINTVIDSDFIIVFSDGRVVEQGAPQVPTSRVRLSRK